MWSAKKWRHLLKEKHQYIHKNALWKWHSNTVVIWKAIPSAQMQTLWRNKGPKQAETHWLIFAHLEHKEAHYTCMNVRKSTFPDLHTYVLHKLNSPVLVTKQIHKEECFHKTILTEPSAAAGQGGNE